MHYFLKSALAVRKNADFLHICSHFYKENLSEAYKCTYICTLDLLMSMTHSNRYNRLVLF